MPTTRRSHESVKGKDPFRKPLKFTVNVLPTELWFEILSYLRKKELKVVRHIGDRYLETLAAPLIFTTAYIAARRGVLDVFNKMTSHPTIRHMIKEVIYDCSWLDPPYGTEQMRSGRFRITKSCDNVAVAELFQEQEQIQVKELTKCLQSAFAQMTHVKRVVFADLARTAGFPGDMTVVDKDGNPLRRRVHYSSISPDISQCCFEELCSTGCNLHQGSLRRQFGGLKPLLRLLSQSTLPTFDELVLGDGVRSSDNIRYGSQPDYVGSSYGGIPHLFFESFVGSFDKHVYPVFARLRKLDLTLCFVNRPRSSNADRCPTALCPALGNLGELLSMAVDLEELRLSGQADTVNLSFSEVMGLTTWSKLRNLEFRYFQATYRELVNHLLRHKRTLQLVKLDYFNLRGGTWQQLDNLVSVEMPGLAVTAGVLWNDERMLLCDDDAEDRLWLPLKPDIRHWGDADEKYEDFDGRESSCDEERDYSDDSEELWSEFEDED